MRIENKQRTLLRTILLLAMLFLFTPQLIAEDYVSTTIGGIKYRVYYTGSKSNAVATYAVCAGADSDFSGHADIHPSVTATYSWIDDDGEMHSKQFTETVTKIAPKAFYGHSGLTGVTIPDCVQTVCGMAFWYCNNLKNVTIGKSVTKLSSIVPGESSDRIYDAFSGNNIITLTWKAVNCGEFGGMGRTNIEQVVIGPNVEVLPPSFVAGSKITAIAIPGSVIKIGRSAFADCQQLTSITISNSVASIGPAAFYNCQSLKNVFIDKTGRLQIAGDVFKNCDNLERVELHCQELDGFFVDFDDYIWFDESQLEYGYQNGYNFSLGSCFSNKPNLKEVIIGNEVEAISPYAFAYCPNLTTVEIGYSLTKIYTDWLVYEDAKRRYYADLGIPIAYRGPYTGLDDDIEDGFTPFRYDSHLTSLSVHDLNPAYDSRNNCNAIILSAEDKLLKGGVNTIIPRTIKTIEAEAFYDCDFTQITIPESVTRIGDNAFCNCENLLSIDLPGVEIIGFFAFRHCSSLKEVKIGANLEYMLSGSFYDSEELNKVTCLAPNPPDFCIYDLNLGVPNFTCTEDATLYVPVQSLNSYKNSDYQYMFAHILPIGASEVIIGDLNGDQEINIADINALIDIILGGAADDAVLDRADVNDDEEVNIADINTLIDIILTRPE